MKIVIGVDGGQSSTLALVASLDGQILGEGHAGPSNHIYEPGGLERLHNALNQSINGALKSANASPADVVSVCLGMTGGATYAAEIAKTLFPNAALHAHNDIVTALAGAATGQSGIVVIAGTGSVAYGRLADGRDARAGGWGYLLGDEGSAYDIGCAALRAIYQAADGRGAPTQLSRTILDQLRFDDLPALHQAMYSGKIERAAIARLAALVGNAAREGDTVSLELLAAAGRSLAACVIAVAERLGQLDLPVYTTGGVFRAGELLLHPFRNVIQSRFANMAVHPAAYSPSVGALFLALQAMTISLDAALLRRVDASLPQSAISKFQS